MPNHDSILGSSSRKPTHTSHLLILPQNSKLKHRLKIDTSLVLPPWAPILALQDDMSFHFMPAFTLTLDLLFFSPPYTIAVLPAVGLSGCIAFGYWFWIEPCFTYNQFYPYPIFDVLSTGGRVGLFAASAGLMTLATGGLVALYGVVNGKEVRRGRSGNVKGE